MAIIWHDIVLCLYLSMSFCNINNFLCVTYFIAHREGYRGKILRFNVDDRDPRKEYAIPIDNPFVNDPSALPEIYAYGIRMPWRCSVDNGDPVTGDGAGRIICTDVGTNVDEEVNIIKNGGNYGYPVFEGDVCLVDNQTCSEGIYAHVSMFQ